MNAVLVHTGYGLMLCALAARDILWLRGTLVLAQSVLALYAWRIGVSSIAAWNVVFVLINTVWVLKIVHERRAVSLPDDLRTLYERHFFALTPQEFLRWWGQGRRETLSGARMASQGQYPEALYFVLGGTARVTRAGMHVTDLPAGHFVAEKTRSREDTKRSIGSSITCTIGNRKGAQPSAEAMHSRAPRDRVNASP